MSARGLVLCVLLACASLAYADIYNYETVQLDAGSFIESREAMWTSTRTPAHKGNPSYCHINLNVTQMDKDKNNTERTIQVVFVSTDDLEHVGYVEDGTRRLCCVDKTPYACEAGRLAVDPKWDGADNFMTHNVATKSYYYGKTQHHFVLNAGSRVPKKSKKQHALLDKPNVYYVFVLNCQGRYDDNDQQSGAVIVDGSIIWKNPYGYLPGDLYRLLPFYGVMSLFYVGAAGVWFVLSACHWRSLLNVQIGISAVVGLGLAECATLYFDKLAQNLTGSRAMGPVVFGVLLSTLKKTVARVFVLIVGMGYSVVRPNLGNTTYRVGVMGVVYFVLAATVEVFSTLKPNEPIPVSIIIFFVVPEAVLDTVFYYWTFISIAKVIAHLHNRGDELKLKMFRKLTWIVGITAAVSVCMMLYQIIGSATRGPDQGWRSAWIVPAFWQVLFYCVLTSIMLLWRPTANNERYSHRSGPRGDERGMTPLANFSPLSQRDGSDDDEAVLLEGGQRPPAKKMNAIDKAAISIANEDNIHHEAEMGKIN